MKTKQEPKSEPEITGQVRELIEYLVCYFQGDTIACEEGRRDIAYAILDGAVGHAALELRLRGELALSLMLQRKDPRTEGLEGGLPAFNFQSLADTLENARGVALMAQVVHDKLAPKAAEAKATEAKSEAA
jgi:hypothetical protein